MAAEKLTDKSRIWLGVFIMLGLVFLGIMAPLSVQKIKSYDRTVTVKGLCEKEVAADKVIWPIIIKVAGNDFASAYGKIEAQNKQIKDFLIKGGVKPEDITINPIEVSDAQTETYNVDRPSRFILKSIMTVCSKDVDLVRGLINNQNQLVEQGIMFVTNDWESGVQYSFESLNDIKPTMVEEATKNAREVGVKFAEDSQSRLGKIKTASQGTFSIYDRDSNTPWIKTVRVVNVVTYYIVD